jgi:hypothetical protein
LEQFTVLGHDFGQIVDLLTLFIGISVAFPQEIQDIMKCTLRGRDEEFLDFRLEIEGVHVFTFGKITQWLAFLVDLPEAKAIYDG